MGQKIHPYGLRLGIVTDWKSRWYSDKDYAAQVNEDRKIRTYLNSQLKRGAVSRIEVERIGTHKVQVDVHTARPGVVIGRGGSEAERLRSGLEKMTNRMVRFNVIEVQNAELDATLLARSVADQLEGRVSFRRAMKRAVATALKAGAEGVRVQAAGRLGGADMGRREWYLEGRVPLHTLRADIDYGQATAATTVGAIGVQVWVYKGDVLPSLASSREKIAAEARLAAGGPAERRRSAKSRAESAAGEGAGKRLIEAGGGKRLVEAGGGKRRPGGKRLIEAGGGRKLTTSDAQGEFEAAREEAEETLVTDPQIAPTPADVPAPEVAAPEALVEEAAADSETPVPEGSAKDAGDAAVEAVAEEPEAGADSETPEGSAEDAGDAVAADDTAVEAVAEELEAGADSETPEGSAEDAGDAVAADDTAVEAVAEEPEAGADADDETAASTDEAEKPEDGV